MNQSTQQKKITGNGGWRPGAGRKKGSKSAKTLEREAVLAAFRQRAMKHADILLSAQLTRARGMSFLYKIEKEKIVGPKGGIHYVNKRPVLVTSEFEIEEYLAGLIEEGDMDNENDPGATYYYITAHEPDNSAIDSILDRTFGKPVQNVDMKSDGQRINGFTYIQPNV